MQIYLFRYSAENDLNPTVLVSLFFPGLFQSNCFQKFPTGFLFQVICICQVSRWEFSARLATVCTMPFSVAVGIVAFFVCHDPCKGMNAVLKPLEEAGLGRVTPFFFVNIKILP